MAGFEFFNYFMNPSAPDGEDGPILHRYLRYNTGNNVATMNIIRIYEAGLMNSDEVWPPGMIPFQGPTGQDN
ncbi:hypothetical protein GCM10028809_58120 [Spirosoma gilvum]